MSDKSHTMQEYPDSFKEIEEATKKILSIPKKQVDDALAEEEKRKQVKRKHKAS